MDTCPAENFHQLIARHRESKPGPRLGRRRHYPHHVATVLSHYGRHSVKNRVAYIGHKKCSIRLSALLTTMMKFIYSKSFCISIYRYTIYAMHALHRNYVCNALLYINYVYNACIAYTSRIHTNMHKHACMDTCIPIQSRCYGQIVANGSFNAGEWTTVSKMLQIV